MKLNYSKLLRYRESKIKFYVPKKNFYFSNNVS